MSTIAWLALISVFILLVAVLYWELVIVEGAHLGVGVVVRLYDWTAGRYESIKRFQPEFEDRHLGLPLSAALATAPASLVLDVAAGTGRLARTLLRQSGFAGRVVALDMSQPMLRQIDRHIPMRSERVDLLLSPADLLPFAQNTFEVVACLEALEFTPDPSLVLCECVRVLRPGGRLVVSNRVGPQARLLVGKTVPRRAFTRFLQGLGLHLLRAEAWQIDYDLVWCTKPTSTEVDKWT